MTTKIISTVFLAVILASLGVCRAQKHNCNDITSINKCLVVFQQVIQEEPFITSEQQLDRACMVIRNSTSCMDAFYKQCMDVERNSLNDASAIIHDNLKKLCDDKEYRKEYFKHVSCHQKTTVSCIEHMKSTMDLMTTGIKAGTTREDMRKTLDHVCRGTVDYINCVRSEAKKKCEKDAYDFISNYELSTVKQLRQNCDPEIYKIDDTSAAVSNFVGVRNSLFMCALSWMAFIGFKRLSMLM